MHSSCEVCVKRFSFLFILFLALGSLLYGTDIKVLLSAEKRTVTLGGEMFSFGRYTMAPKKASAVDGRIFVDGVDTGRWIVELVPHKGFYTINGRSYRGTLLLATDYLFLYVINKVDIESYLKGVLPREIVPTWPRESLKAQAVAARTYAYRMLKDNGTKLWHLDASHLSQVYGGKDGETEATSRAVDETRDIVLTYRGKLLTAFYHASSGGVTARPSDIWKVRDGEYPYLRSFQDPWSLRTPHDSWECRFKISEIAHIFDTGPLRKILVEYSHTGRAVSLELVSDRGTVKISGNDFRLRLGPSLIKSTYFKASIEGGALLIRGKGFGHGVGLSQWGARNMAAKGYSYKEILNFYYRDVSLAKIRW